MAHSVFYHIHNTACYNYGCIVNSMVPAQWNSLGAIAISKEKRDYLANLGQHDVTSSQKDVWKGLCYLWLLLEHWQIFNCPMELDPNILTRIDPYLQLSSSTTPFEASVPGVKNVQDHFLWVRNNAEKCYPSLLNKTSTSSS